MVGRFVVLVLFLVVALVAVRFTPLAHYLTREALAGLLGQVRGTWWAPLAFVGLYVVLCPFGIPVSPLILAGGVVFGAAAGTLYNIVGNFLGAAVTFFVARHLGRDFVVHLLGSRLDRVERLLARHGFWTLLRIRFVPVPFPVVNYGAALAGVSAPVFLWSSFLGLAPAIFLYTFFAAALFEATGPRRQAVAVELAATLLGIFAVSFLPGIVRRVRRGRRLRALRAERARRRGA